MTSLTVETQRSPVQRQLEAYEISSALIQPDELVRRPAVETMAVGVSVFHLLRERINAWEERVFRGTQDYSQDDDEFLQRQLRNWLRITDDILRNLTSIEASLDVVDEVDRLRANAAEARQVLDSWVSPQISAAVGLREMTLSVEGGAELERLLDRERTREVPPSRSLRKIQPADADFLK